VPLEGGLGAEVRGANITSVLDFVVNVDVEAKGVGLGEGFWAKVAGVRLDVLVDLGNLMLE
jgi:hypothetical protein